jgi:hypothetical protein
VPRTPEQYKIQVTVGRETIEKLRRVQDLMRHVIPNGEIELRCRAHNLYEAVPDFGPLVRQRQSARDARTTVSP